MTDKEHDTSIIREAVSAWKLPNLPGSGVTRSTRRPRKNESIETVQLNNPSQHLTAENLQEITETARRDGMEQGLKQGIEQGLREGRLIGEKEGKQIAYNEARKETELLQAQLRSLIDNLMEPLLNRQSSIENTLVDMVLNITKILVKREIEHDPQLLIDIIQPVVDSVGSASENIRLFLCEGDAKKLSELMPENQRKWKIEIDAALDSGGCRVETDSSISDFSIDARFSQFEQHIHKKTDSNVNNNDALPEYHRTQKNSADADTLVDDNTKSMANKLGDGEADDANR